MSEQLTTPDRDTVAPRQATSTGLPHVEGTKWSFGLVGFYLSCAGVALGATIGAAGYLWFESVGALIFGCLMTPICGVTCFLSLRAARR